MGERQQLAESTSVQSLQFWRQFSLVCLGFGNSDPTLKDNSLIKTGMIMIMYDKRGSIGKDDKQTVIVKR